MCEAHKNIFGTLIREKIEAFSETKYIYTIINVKIKKERFVIRKVRIKNRCLHVPECTCVIISQQMDNCFSQVGICF